MTITINTPVTTADGTTIGWCTDRRGGPSGPEVCVVTPGPVPSAAWHPEADLTPRPWPPPLPVGTVASVYGQQCTVTAYDPGTHTYDLTATLILPPPHPATGIAYGYVETLHHYPDVPACHVHVWHGENPPETPAEPAPEEAAA
jgi:hypothetical protein